MARSKSLKIQNQLVNDNVKCNRMLIKNYDKLTNFEFYHDDKTSITLLNLKNKNESFDQTKEQLKNELIDSLNKRQIKIDKNNENLDKLKLELENNLKIDNQLNELDDNYLNNNNKFKQSIKDNLKNKKSNLRATKNLSIKTSNYSLDDNWFLNSTNNLKNHNLTNYENREQQLSNEQQLLNPNKQQLSNEQQLLNSNEQQLLNSNEQQLSNSPQLLNPNKQQLSNSNEQLSTNLQDQQSTELNGYLNCLTCTKQWLLFTKINWQRKYCILDNKLNKLIIKDNKESKEFKEITLDNYECFGPIKLAKLNKKAENVFGLNNSNEKTPTSLLDFRHTFSADTDIEMFKWLEGLKRSIFGGRNKKNSTRKKAKDVNDVNLESIEETKILNIAHKVNGPKNRRLPKRNRNRDTGQSSLENSYDSTDLISNNSENVKSINESPIHQFKPNLNELDLNRLKTNKLNKISTSKENELNNLDQHNEKVNSRNEITSDNCFQSNKVRANSMSILDDTDCVDKSNLINRLNKKDQIKNNRSIDYLEQTNTSNLFSKREQLIQQIKINKENKSKSMMSLTKNNELTNLNSLKNLNNSKSNLPNSINDSNQFNQQSFKDNKLFQQQSTKTSVISRNNSSGSNRSYSSSINSDHTNGSTGDQSIEFNLNNNRSNVDTSSKLKKRINSKKVLNNQFSLNDDETLKTNQIDKNVTHNFNNNLNRVKLSNQLPNRNRASLNLTNNNVDELKLKFIEKGLSVDNLLSTNEE